MFKAYKKKELENQGFKTYENDDIQVYWNPQLCQHAGKCVRGNAAVFDPKRRPWIDLSKADTQEIAAVIDQCPSKALQYQIKDQVSVVFEEDLRRSAAYNEEKLIGKCEFRGSGDQWTIFHTGVRPEYKGQGIAERLVKKIIEEARSKNKKIIPLCPYAKKMMMGNDEYQDVL